MENDATVNAAIDRARRRRELLVPALARQLRLQVGLSQNDVADIVGVTAAAVSFWESGQRHPRDPKHVLRYSDLLNRLVREVGREDPQP